MLSLLSNRARRQAATGLLLGLSLTGTAGGAGTPAPADGSVAALNGALARARHELAVKRDKLKRHLLPAMRANGVAMWIIVSREFNVDPVLDLFGGYGLSGWYGHRNAYIFRDAGGSAGLEAVLIGTHQSDYMLDFFDRIVGYGEEGLSPHLREYVHGADPDTIAINRSRTVAMADGLSAELLGYLQQSLGEEYAGRFVSSEDLLFDYVGVRTPAEVEIEANASWRTWHILRRAFSNEVVTPGETRLMDVWGWIVDEWRTQGLEFNFAPSLSLHRQGVEDEIPASANAVIRPGDLLHVDFGVRLMGLVTDQQHLAYVLKPGETAPPDGLVAAFDASVRAAEIYAAGLVPGRTGVEVKNAVEREAAARGIDLLVYGHTQGNWVHGVGARTVFDWPERYGIFAVKPVRVNEFWSVEFRTLSPIPEWDGQHVPMRREEDAWIDGDGTLHYFTGPQDALWLIKPVPEA